MLVNTTEHEITRLLTEGQSAARRGDRAMARALLTQLVEQDPRNEEAWMWLSGVVTDADEQQICLENALVINPNNAQARKGLDFILSKTGTPSRVPPAAPADARQQASPAVDAPETPQQALAQPEAVEPDSAPTAAADTATPTMQSDPEPANNEAASAPEQPAVPVPDAPAPAAPAPRADYMPNLMGDPPTSFEVDAATGFDAQPFVPPGMEEFTRAAEAQARRAPSTPLAPSVLNTSPEQVGDELPSWLQELTPSALASAGSGNSGPFTPFNMSDYPTHGANTNLQTAQQNTSALPAPGTPFHPGEFGAPTPNGSNGSAAPAGPYADLQMPLPHELPGGMEGFGGPPQQTPAQNQSPHGDAQPWYLRGASGPSSQNGSTYLDSTMLKSTSLNSTMLTSSLVEDKRAARVVPTIDCPNCHEQVPETSLACPTCGYNYFVNCPHCHELVDTSHCVPGEVDPCPYCEKPVEGWKLGLGGVPDLVSQKNPGSRPVGAGDGPDPAFASTKQVLDIDTSRHVRSFGWVVDLLWLVAIIAMVWAFTQLPIWFHLTGQY
jgi:hypothetical protein